MELQRSMHEDRVTGIAEIEADARRINPQSPTCGLQQCLLESPELVQADSARLTPHAGPHAILFRREHDLSETL